MMRSKVILINWVLSFMSLSIDTEKSSLVAALIILSWFLVSTLLLIRANERGVFRKIEKHF